MSRKPFQDGLSCYQAGNYREALQHFNKALERGGKNSYLILDSRAAAYLKLGETKEAMKDAKKTIDVAPDRWQGYSRAARLFLKMKKFDASRTMLKMAMDRLKDEETERHASLLSLEAEVLHAEAQALKAARDLERLSADHMSKLPIELFGEIAKLLVQENHSASIILSQISSHWRDVVHNLPFLWNVLVLTRRRPRQKAKLWIERSKGRIRELCVRSSVFDVPHWTGDALDLLEWRYLRIFRVQKWDAVSFLQSIGQLHCLSKLEHYEVESPDRKAIFLGGTQDCEDPRLLRRLTIVSAVLPANSLPTRVRNLTSLTLQDVMTAEGDLADLLEANPLLEHLSLKHVAYGNNRDAKFSLPCISVLETKGLHPPFIYTLGLPELQILRVESPTISRDLSSFLRHLVTTNTSHLTEISLRSCSCDPNSIIELLKISPDLQRLEVSNNSMHATPVIEFLAGSHLLTDRIPPSSATDSPILCPNLTHVNFSRCPDVQTGPLVRMVKSRLPPAEIQQEGDPVDHIPHPTAIASLVIDECPQVDSTWLAWFRQKVGSVSCVYMKKTTKFRA